MNKREYLHKLYLLQDLDLLINQVKDPEYELKTGLKVMEKKVVELEEKRKELARELLRADPVTYQKYELLKRRYGKGIARVVNHMCTNCFAALPASVVPRDDEIITCSNCGIILIWLE